MESVNPLLELTIDEARRVAVSAQGLDEQTSCRSTASPVEVVERLGCIQIDPIRSLDYTQHLVLWSRIGSFERGELARLLYDEKLLFEYWAHCASIVATRDYPLHATWMRDYAAVAKRDMAWVAANPRLYNHIRERLAHEGPLSSDQFDASLIQKPWRSSGWSNDRSVSMMLTFLWLKGEIMVAQRVGRKRFWHLRDAMLPAWTPREELSQNEAVALAVQRTLRALGIATPKQITQYFTRGNYPNLSQTLAQLTAEGQIQRATVRDGAFDLPGDWYVHSDSLTQVASIRSAGWGGHTTLLSPFDNLISDRERTKLLFDFRYRIEIYVPKAKREFGYYVLPILHNADLIGRVDAKFERKRGALVVNAVYAEADAPPVGLEVAKALEDLAQFLGATRIDYPGICPPDWSAALS